MGHVNGLIIGLSLVLAAAAIFTIPIGHDLTGLAVGDQIVTQAMTQGWATFGQALPQGKAFDGLQVSNLPTQTDIKVKWPDGSIRFAVVTTKITSGGNYASNVGSASSGSFTPTVPSASVMLNVGGTVYTANLPSSPTSDSWMSGPLVREWRSVVAPTTSSGTQHALLQVIFDIRCYNDGACRVDVTVQNVKDVSSGNGVSYDVNINVGGSTVYNKSGVWHPYLTRWRKTFATGGLVESQTTPDFDPFYQANALPRFSSTVDNSYGTPSGSKYDILGFGDMNPDMAAPGGRPEIAWYPYWTAQYLVHKTQGQRAYMLKQGDLSGSWSGHITEADGATIISLDKYPNYWLDSRADPSPSGPAARGIPGSTYWLENAHLPSLAFVPYLVTGDRYYLDQQKFWANFVMLRTWPGDGQRQAGAGILMQNQERGIAWGLRAIGDLVAYLPDGDSDKAYFRSKLQNNLNALDSYARSFNSGPLETLFWGKYPSSNPNQTIIPPWQHAFVAYELDRMGGHGFAPVAAMRDRILRLWVRLWTSDPDFPRECGAPYNLLVASGGRAYQTMRELWQANGFCQPLLGYYDGEARTMMIIAKREGISGASGALDFLNAYSGLLTDLNKRSGYAIAEAGSITPPPSNTPPTVSITSPANGATVSSTIAITATASDNVGVAGVQFKVDGADIGAEDTASPYSTSLNTATLTNGPHTLTAVARDAGGLTASSSITVTVNNVVVSLPTSTFSSTPTSITAGQSVTLTWTTTGATTISIDQGIGTVAASGTRIVSPTQTTTYTLTATNTAGSVTRALTLSVIRPAVCGNGILESGEQCDDANTNNNDACKNDCTNNVCGDGIVRTGVEACDSGSSNGICPATCSSTCITNTCPLPAPNLTPALGLVGYWKFDDGSGTIATDSSGNNNYGTVLGATWVPGKFNKALSFNGIDNSVDIGIIDTSDSTFTYSFWANTNVPIGGTPFSESTSGSGTGCSTTNGIFVGYSDVGSFAAVEVAVGTNGVSVSEHAASHAPVVASYQAGLSGWNHIVIVSNSPTNMKLYVNGVEMDTALNTVKTRIIDVEQIGFKGACTRKYFNGLIDEVLVYNRSLSSQEIQDLFNGQPTTPNVTTTDISILSPSATPTQNSATVKWLTNVPAASRVDYGTDTNYGLTVQDAAFITNHSSIIVNLNSNRTYYFRINSTDILGNSKTFASSFKTLVVAVSNYSQVVVNGKIVSFSTGKPCANCLVTITLKNITVTATTDSNGYFSAVITTNLRSGRYTLTVKINDGTTTYTYSKRIRI